MKVSIFFTVTRPSDVGGCLFPRAPAPAPPAVDGAGRSAGGAGRRGRQRVWRGARRLGGSYAPDTGAAPCFFADKPGAGPTPRSSGPVPEGGAPAARLDTRGGSGQASADAHMRRRRGLESRAGCSLAPRTRPGRPAGKGRGAGNPGGKSGSCRAPWTWRSGQIPGAATLCAGSERTSSRAWVPLRGSRGSVPVPAVAPATSDDGEARPSPARSDCACGWESSGQRAEPASTGV